MLVALGCTGPAAHAANRGVELVSPPGSQPYSVMTLVAGEWPVVAQEDGDAYWISGAGAGDPGDDDGSNDDVFLAKRGAGGSWSSMWLTAFDAPPTSQGILRLAFGTASDGVSFLTPADIAPNDNNGVGNPFLDPADLYRAVPGDVALLSAPPDGESGSQGVRDTSFPATTPDLSVSVFVSAAPLLASDTDANADVYRRGPDGLELVSISSDGTAENSPNDAALSGGIPAAGGFPASNGYTDLSEDGKVAAFTTTASLHPADEDAFPDIYVWADGDVAIASDAVVAGAECDSEFSGCVPPRFVGMAANGSVVYVETTDALTTDDLDAAVDIYTYRLSTGTVELATGGASTSDVYPLAVSANGRLFFASSESLGNAGPVGPVGALYRWNGSGIELIAERGPDDPALYDQSALDSITQGKARDRPIRATANGDALLFTTSASLDPGDGDGAVDVYLWMEGSGLRWISGDGTAPARPGAQGVTPFLTQVAGRIMSTDARRVFFQSTDALTADAPTDSTPKLYEWEQGVGTSLVAATSEGVTYGDSTPSGDDVFFTTAAAMSATDTDGGELDLYDARVGSPGDPPGAGGGSIGGPVPNPEAPGPSAPPSIGSATPQPPEAPPGPSVVPPGGQDPEGASSIQLVSRRLDVRGRHVEITIDTSSPGRVKARLRQPGSGRLLARGQATFAATGDGLTLRMRLTQRARRLLAKGQRVRGALTAVLDPGAAGPATRDRAIVHLRGRRAGGDGSGT